MKRGSTRKGAVCICRHIPVLFTLDVIFMIILAVKDRSFVKAQKGYGVIQ